MLDAHCSLLKEMPVCYFPCAERAFLDHVAEHYDGLDRLPHAEISNRYRSYMKRASKDRNLAVLGRSVDAKFLRGAWTKMLRCSKQVDTVRLRPVSRSLSQMKYCITDTAPGKCKSCSQNVSFIEGLSGGSGDSLTTAVIETLGLIALPIRKLSIECGLKHAPSVNSTYSSDWRRMRLAHVETVTIGELPYDTVRFQEAGSSEHKTTESSTAFHGKFVRRYGTSHCLATAGQCLGRPFRPLCVLSSGCLVFIHMMPDLSSSTRRYLSNSSPAAQLWRR